MRGIHHFLLVVCVSLLAALSGCSDDESVCAGVACGAGRCVNDSGSPACVCNSGFVSDGLACVAPSACAPNPCAGEHRVCSIESGKSVCGCAPGFLPVVGVCVPDATWTCSEAHVPGGDAFEPDDCPSTARALTPGASLTGHTLAPAKDEDWLRIDAQAGHGYAVTATATSEAALFLDLYGPEATSALASDHLARRPAQLSFKAATAGAHYLRVRAAEEGTTDAYTVTLVDLGADDFADAPADAQVAAIGAPLAGTLQAAGDADVVRVSLTEKHTYLFEAKLAGEGNTKLQLDVLAADGTSALGHAEGKTASLPLRAKTSGSVFVRVSTLEASASGIAWTLTTQDLGADDHGDTPVDATAIAPAPAAKAELERSGDADVFSFEAQALHAYRFTVTAAQFAVQAKLLDATGKELPATATSAGSVLTFSAATQTTLFLKVTAYNNGPATGSYTFALQDLGSDDHAGDFAHATALPFGTQGLAGSLETAGDVDAFSFAATAGHIYRFTCTTSARAGSCRVNVVDQAGSLVARGDIQSQSAVFSAPATATYVGQVSTQGADLFTYTVTVVDLGVDDCGDDAASAKALSVPTAPTNGSLDFPGDKDVYSFAATADRIYRITCTRGSMRGGCALKLSDAAGGTLQTSQGGQASVTLAFEAPASGQLFLEVSSSLNGDVGTYQYQLEDVGSDDFGDTLATATSMTPGDPASTGDLESSGDLDVFSFVAVPEHVYRFTALSTSPTTLSGLKLRLKNAAGDVLATADRTPLAWEATAAGTFYVEVGASAVFNNIGSYSRLLEDLGLDDFGDTLQTATRVQLATAQTGVTETSADVDVFVVAVNAGRIVRATCTPAENRGCNVRLKSPSGTTLGGSGNQGTALWESTAAGDVFVEVLAGSGTIGSYSVIVEDLGTDDHGDDAASATAAQLGVAINGSFETPGDVDVFSYSLVQGTIYRLTLSIGAQTTVLDPNGSTVPLGGGSPRTFTAPVSGTYSVRLQSGANVPASYVLTVQ